MFSYCSTIKIAGKQLNKRIHASINLRLISLCRLSKLALTYLHILLVKCIFICKHQNDNITRTIENSQTIYTTARFSRFMSNLYIPNRLGLRSIIFNF